jgi:hypothetical protein
MAVFGPTDLIGGATVAPEHLEHLGGSVGSGNRVAPDYEVVSAAFTSIVVPP